jgi:hypothetical protein
MAGVALFRIKLEVLKQQFGLQILDKFLLTAAITLE